MAATGELQPLSNPGDQARTTAEPIMCDQLLPDVVQPLPLELGLWCPGAPRLAIRLLSFF